MTDANLRELERVWKESGSLEDEVAYLAVQFRPTLISPASIFRKHLKVRKFDSPTEEGNYVHTIFTKLPQLAVAYSDDYDLSCLDLDPVFRGQIAHYANTTGVIAKISPGEPVLIDLETTAPEAKADAYLGLTGAEDYFKRAFGDTVQIKILIANRYLPALFRLTKQKEGVYLGVPCSWGESLRDDLTRGLELREEERAPDLARLREEMDDSPMDYGNPHRMDLDMDWEILRE